MPETISIERVTDLLADRYGDAGRRAGEHLETWLSGSPPFAYAEMIEQHLAEDHLDLLFDAFWQVVPFGTGGRRGHVGYGPNRLNPTTIALTVQGHCDLLKRSKADGSAELAVVVANDVRVFNDIASVYQFLPEGHPLIGVSSRSLARLACEIYAGNGIRSWFLHPGDDVAFMSTPELSFLIPELGAAGGINLSASHNPPDDNGIKIYDATGSQSVAPDDQRLVDTMEKVSTVSRLPFDEAREQGLVQDVPDDFHEAYLKTYVALYDSQQTPDPEIPIVYTPLGGCGLTSAGEVLERLGFPMRVPPGEGADGTFAAIPFRAPNPEVPEATRPAREFADEIGSGIVLSSDPDADRVGLEVKLADGSWYHFDGQQISAVLCYLLMLDPAGPQRRGLVVETLVTTKLLRPIVEAAGDSFIVDDLLVGFKYIANVLSSLERDGRYDDITCPPSALVLAAEESHGIMVVQSIRDKDSTPACMYLAGLYQRLRREGRTLLDYYAAILEELGGYAEANRSIMLAGAAGVEHRDRIMNHLRSSPPDSIGGAQVSRVVDYWDEVAWGPFVSESDRLPRNLLQFFTDKVVVTVRPSGTEPKVKFYCQLLPGDHQRGARGVELFRQVRAAADEVANVVYNELLAALDLTLSKAALLLPDLIELDSKLTFDAQTVPGLRERLAGGKESFDDVLSWLRGQAANLVPGADALPALRAPLAYLAEEWSEDSDMRSRVDDLRSWATE